MQLLIIIIISTVFWYSSFASIEEQKTIKSIICEIATEHGVDCQIMWSISGAETNQKNIVGYTDKDSTGLFQINLPTAKWLIEKNPELWPYDREITLADIQNNLYLASHLATLRYLDCRRAIKTFALYNKRLKEILCYKEGPTGVLKLLQKKVNLRTLAYWKRYVYHWERYE